MADKGKNGTDEKKYSESFEELSQGIVEYLFRGTGAKITPTKPSKDGGYDIIVSCRHNRAFQKAFFECKLRNKNLNLRDIAANAIIAFNLGSVALVAVTNHDFTPQTGSHLRAFRDRTVLNIKIITGTEFLELIKKSHMEAKMPEGLKNLIYPSKHRKTDRFEVLRFDFEKDIIEQIFCREKDSAGKMDAPIALVYSTQMEQLEQGLEAGKLLVVTGYWGVGKNELIHAVMDRSGKRVVEINALIPVTRDQLLLMMLSEIWGISEIELFSLFTKSQVNKITKTIGGEENDTETVRTLISLFNAGYESKRSSAVQNMLIAQYIVKLLLLHRDNIGFAVYIDNLQFSSKEIYDFLDYLIKELHENQIGCVVRHDIPEYQDTGRADILETWKHLTRYAEIKLAPLGYEDAVRYTKATRPKLSDHTTRVIVKQVGTRTRGLSDVLTYLLQERGVSEHDDRRLAQMVQVLTPNDVPGLMDTLLQAYRARYPVIFALSYLLDCRIPVKIYQISGAPFPHLDRLIEAGIFRVDQNVIIAQSKFVQEWIQKMSGSGSSAYTYSLAEELLEKLGDRNGEYTIEKISLYHAIGKDKDALALLDVNLHELTRDKQYTALGRGLTLAIEMARNLHDIARETDYLIQALDLMTVQKELTGDLAQERIDQLACCVGRKHDLPSYTPIALAYFRLKRSFKLSEYTDQFLAVRQGRDYYVKCLRSDIDDNHNDWLGRLCSCYALTVKSTQGNDAALQAFEDALAVLPDSFELRREYFSHLACMELFNDPIAAFNRYQEILALFEREAPDAAALPFHEYGDLAMSQLVAGNLDYAQELTKRAIQISRSNGLIDEEGRNINIKGCVELCACKLEDAKASFREATAIMRHAGSWHYAWRSELNYIELCGKEGHDDPELMEDLERLYDEFESLLAPKITLLAASHKEGFCQTREYHALLVLGACLTRFKQAEKAQVILPRDFKLNAYTETFLQHLHCFLREEPDFMKSPYLKNGYIYLVG